MRLHEGVLTPATLAIQMSFDKMAREVALQEF
jgi:hypothetical protein